MVAPGGECAVGSVDGPKAGRDRALEAVWLVLVTAPNEEVGAELAKALVQERLAACVNLAPSVRSVYRWKGALCDERESALWIKTRQGCLERLQERIRALHPYEVPEIVALPVQWGSRDYLSWVLDETSGAQGVEPAPSQGVHGIRAEGD
jgi:periplasmic divalent cation tolerance protein